MASPDPVEIEATLVVVAEDRGAFFDLLRERDEFAGLACSGFRERRLGDRYFDLSGALLAEADRALRVRSQTDAQGTRTLLGFKGPAQAGQGLGVTRLELEDDWSTAFLAQVLSRLESDGIQLPRAPRQLEGTPEEVMTVLGFQLVQERETTRLATELRRGADSVAELVLDHVVYDLGAVRLDHREIEIEALGDTGAPEVSRMAQELLEQHESCLRAWTWSKTALGRALEDMHASGGLAHLMNGSQLSRAGYDELARRLA